MNLKRCLLFSLLPVFLFSCKKENALPEDMGYSYYPVNLGHWVIYDVDSISYNDFTGKIDSFKYQIREVIAGNFEDAEGRETQRVERYIRLTDGDAWTIKEVWYVNKTPSTAERVEENQRFIKLAFPVNKNAKWDGNAYNTLGEQYYKFISVDEPRVAGNIAFDSTVNILQMEEYTLISEDFREEVYARNVGMIYKKFVQLTKQPTGEVIKGIDYSYTIRAYGN